MPSTDRPVAVSKTRLERTQRLVAAAARWAAVGAVLGTAVSLGLLTVWSARGATDTAFALGALVLGFGVTAWSTAVGLGRTIEGMQDRLDVSSGWTEASAREAFFVISWTGAGWVVAAAACSILLGV
ncbi:DUF7268 family protein [Natrinema salsiterrestre]|uniref:Uncharacterized protein n=1 Tax=Natrinema salsiterrestre TaxID=2950540 RepID=A0A9Q4PZ36_9EURY|nr:hypothetical protein [Natrinema salsiterrestre]MDF9744045.1 hypothetical protein [Natrinema salsiterrestre]